MIDISLCMIVKDEEETLARCLDTIQDIVDEINIVDTGSTDRTVEIATAYTDRIFYFPWIGDAAAARNESFRHATKEYILYLDADDVMLEADRDRLRELKQTLDPAVDSVSMYYNTGEDEFGNVTLRFRRNRLVKRSRGFQWYGASHEYLSVSGHIIDSNVAVTHRKLRHTAGKHLSIFDRKIADGEAFTSRDYFYHGNELREHGHYAKAIVQYMKHLAAPGGWTDDSLYACIYMGDCYRYLGDPASELSALLKSFAYGAPRPEALCRVGQHFLTKANYKTAVWWFERAAQFEPDPQQWSFSFPAYFTWYPHLQLCICYYYLGEYQKSWQHNEEARKYRPEDRHVVYNKGLLEWKLAEVATVPSGSGG